ncbi:ultraviolet-B receptor UVR8 isoform X2 [Cryptomeria japonica]|uniref:ultraviolet-B receptor UVR8 isoform X2 n=1 Tax=Cryptomeria japonica TaxID=3369 RepID=UPI0027D9F3F4|nr:ultraviolet-B receptor UVR8 isoform X2 [Cryptomeria japonica]
MEGAICEGGSRRVLLVSAGASHTVAVLSGNVVCSWGRGEDGQLGHGDAEDRHKPTIISDLDGCEITSVICGADHTTAYSDTRLVVYSWGWGDFGRLGHGNSSDLFIPHSIKLLYGLKIKQIACGDSHCLAVTRDGEVQSWGRNQNGQLGLGNTEDSLVPQKIQAFEGLAIKMVAAGAEHTVAVSEDGNLYGWGWGRYGNLGLADRNDRFIPEEVATINGEKFSMIACGWRHTIAVSDSGNLYTYGWSKYGQLGHGDYEDHLVPCRVEGLRNYHIAQISGGWRHTMALDKEGQIYGWGWNKFGQVGVGDNIDHCSPLPVTLPVEQKVVQVSCGWRHTVAVTDKHNVFSWGRGTSGQLGHGDINDRNIPQLVEALSADGSACQQIQTSKEAVLSGSNWISPSERYALVPDESGTGQVSLASNSAFADASVPNSDAKRVRTGQ